MSLQMVLFFGIYYSLVGFLAQAFWSWRNGHIQYWERRRLFLDRAPLRPRPRPAGR